MKTRFFIVPPDSERNGIVVLDGPEFHHGMRVSRVRIGDVVRLIDGRGGVYEARVDRINGDNAVLHVLSFHRERPLPPVDVAVGIVKAPRLEVAVEKCTELGARAIVPFVSERCVWRGDGDDAGRKLDRLRRKILASCKQSGQSYFPVIESIATVDALAGRISLYEAVYLADQAGGPPVVSREITGPLLGIVGPEGGLSPAERERLIAAGAVPVSLGRQRLRGETAAICLLYRLMSDYPDGDLP